MITGLLVALLGVFTQLFPSFFSPLTSIFDGFASDVSNFFVYLSSFLNMLISVAGSYVDFALELFAIPVDVFNACCIFLLAKLTIPVLAYIVKLILRWYQALMPTK